MFLPLYQTVGVAQEDSKARHRSPSMRPFETQYAKKEVCCAHAVGLGEAFVELHAHGRDFRYPSKQI